MIDVASQAADIDQVIVKKLGGYNLKTVKWWLGLPPLEQITLIEGGSIQFFASGVEIAPAAAAKQLSTNLLAEPGAATGFDTGPVRVSWSRRMSGLFHTTYRRQVVAGPRWEITRQAESTVDELHVVRGYADPAAYDLTDPDGSRRLSDDLFADALGLSQESLPPLRAALDYFKRTFFDVELGNRPWETSAATVRYTAAASPHLELVEEDEETAEPSA